MKKKTPTSIRMGAALALAYERFAERLRHIAKKKGLAPPPTRDIAVTAFELAYEVLSGKLIKDWQEKEEAAFQRAGEVWMKAREAQLHEEYLQKSLGLINEAFGDVFGPGVVAAKINADGVVETRYLGQDETGDLAHTAAWMKAARAAGEGDNDWLQ